MSREEPGSEVALYLMIGHLFERSTRKKQEFRLHPADPEFIQGFIAKLDVAWEQLIGQGTARLPQNELDLLTSAVPQSIRSPVAKSKWLTGMAATMESWRDGKTLGPLQIKKVREYFSDLIAIQSSLE